VAEVGGLRHSGTRRPGHDESGGADAGSRSVDLVHPPESLATIWWGNWRARTGWRTGGKEEQGGRKEERGGREGGARARERRGGAGERRWLALGALQKSRGEGQEYITGIDND